MHGSRSKPPLSRFDLSFSQKFCMEVDLDLPQMDLTSTLISDLALKLTSEVNIFKRTQIFELGARNLDGSEFRLPLNRSDLDFDLH